MVDSDYVESVEAYSLVVGGAGGELTELRTLVVAKSLRQAAMGTHAGSVMVRVCPSANRAGDGGSNDSLITTPTASAQIFHLAGGSNASAATGSGGITFCGQTFDGSTSGVPIGDCTPLETPIDGNGCVTFTLPPLQAAVVVMPLR